MTMTKFRQTPRFMQVSAVIIVLFSIVLGFASAQAAGSARPRSAPPLGQTIWLRADSNGQYVSADQNLANVNLLANRPSAQGWEMFTIVDAGSGRVALRASNGRYVSADQNLSSYLVANRTSIQGWEMFTWVDAGTGKVQLRANANNMYVSADVNLANTQLVANRATAQGWETFSWGTGTSQPPTGFSSIMSEAQFNQMFPNRNSFYTYQGLVNAQGFYTAFGGTGTTTLRKQEVAAAMANFAHETGGLFYITEINQGLYCDSGNTQYPCAAGQRYYGRGPIQLSWNYNYGTAGAALGLPLLTNPNLVQQDASVAWKTALWYWQTQNGPGTMTPHNCIVNGAGFGCTIRSINGSLECNGGNPGQVQSRINYFNQFLGILGVPAPPGSLTC